MQKQILGEQSQKFKLKNNQVEIKDAKFRDYLQTIMNMVNKDFAED